MKVKVQTHTKARADMPGTPVETYDLYKYSTHYTISISRTGREYPEVRVGKQAYIRKLWKEMTNTGAAI